MYTISMVVWWMFEKGNSNKTIVKERKRVGGSLFPFTVELASIR